MASIDLAAYLSRVLVELGLAVWVGGTFLAAVAAAKLFTLLPSRAKAGEIFGEILRVLDRAKFIAAGAILVGLLFEVQASGSALPRARVVRAVLLFLLVATHVYAVMVVQPRMRYYREKVADLDSAPEDDPFRKKFRAQHKRNERVTVAGLLLAIAAILAG